MRTPRDIIGDDAYAQLVFEGYKVVRDDHAIKLGAHVADNGDGIWQGVVTHIKRVDGGIAAPGIAICDTGRNKPREWNLSRLMLCAKPDWVDWPMPTVETPIDPEEASK